MNWGILIATWWIWLPLGLIGIGGLGILLDREHRKNLAYRRGQVGHVFVTNLGFYPSLQEGVATQLLASEVVLSVNRLLFILARIKLFFGGEVRTFHDLMTRARQEAVLRLIEQGAQLGYDAIGNVRIEPVDISGVTTNPNQRNRQGVFVGIIAYGTAYKRTPDAFPFPAPPTLIGHD
jgi:uncharacterized protein YbjQ (UPF0145 family)